MDFFAVHTGIDGLQFQGRHKSVCGNCPKLCGSTTKNKTLFSISFTGSCLYATYTSPNPTRGLRKRGSFNPSVHERERVSVPVRDLSLEGPSVHILRQKVFLVQLLRASHLPTTRNVYVWLMEPYLFDTTQVYFPESSGTKSLSFIDHMFVLIEGCRRLRREGTPSLNH